MDITLERIGRTVVVRGPDGKPLGQPVSGQLEDLLTYFERHYDFTAAADGAGGFSLVRRNLYAIDTRTGFMYFPLGLRPRVSSALQKNGHRIRYVGGTLIASNPTAHTADWDGLMAEFQVYPGQDTCLMRIASSDGGIIAANTGWGKAQTLDSTVFTPSGPIRMGDISVGDRICHPNGGSTTVIAVHPQGVKQIFRVTFSDGRHVECCVDHLWRVRRRGKRSAYEVHPLSRIMADLRMGDGESKWYVDTVAPLEFQTTTLPIPAYTLGVLLGDGSFTQNSVGWCKPDADIRNAVISELPEGLAVTACADGKSNLIVAAPGFRSKKSGNRPDWHEYRAALSDLGLMGCGSLIKFIPKIYLYGDVATRSAVLGGLLDTDGYVSDCGHKIEYSTSSPQLATDVRALVESLGGITSWEVKKTAHADSFRMCIRLPDAAKYFRLGRKWTRVASSTTCDRITRAIRDVVYVGDKPAQCITVSDTDGLYVTDGCIPTHNSVLLRMLCRLYNKAKIHVVTKARTLAHEIFADLDPVIPNLGFVGGGKNRQGRVTVFMADSLHHGMGDCDILLADEIHELCAPKYAEKLGMYTRARMFGMSATPTGRSDNRDLVGEAMFGPILYTVSYQDAQAQGRVVPITVEWLRMSTGPSLGGIKFPAAREKIGVWRNAVRNAAIAERARQFSQDEQVLVMVKTIEHAVQLKALLPEFSLAYAKDGMDERRISDYQRRGLLPADEPVMTGARVEQLRTEFAAGTLKKVIANYVWSTGVNFRTLAALIRADAAGSEIRDGQIPGRVCRRVAGVKEAAVMVDCWDEWDPTLLGRARKRKANYAKRGWAQVFQTPQKGT